MDFDAVADELKVQVESLKKLLDLTSEDLKYKWEAWALNTGHDSNMSPESFAAFKDHLYSVTRSTKKPRLYTPRSGKTGPALTPVPPKTHHKTATVLPSDPPSSPGYEKYSSRTDRGEVVLEWGTKQTLENSSQMVEVPSTEAYKAMYVKVSDISKAIDDDVEQFLEDVQEKYHFEDEEICNPAIATQQESWAVGRLIAKTQFGHGDIHLQTCRRFGAGLHVALDTDQLENFSFFEGQIVAFKGTNPTGAAFIASELMAPSLPRIEAKNTDTSIIVAAGPFTTRDSLDYAPLRDLIGEINTLKPSAAVLIGPFVEPTHPLVIAGDVGNAVDLDDLFKLRVTPLLNKLQVPCILVPAQADNALPFPQPPLQKKGLHIPVDCKCTGNPGNFKVNGTTVTVGSIDVLQDINRSMYKKGERYGSAFKHLVEQRSLYPVSPARRPVDVTHMYLARLDNMPQILIVPSQINPLVEDVQGVLCINPGRLTKTTAAGKYTVIWATGGEGSLTGRVHVEIKKI